MQPRTTRAPHDVPPGFLLRPVATDQDVDRYADVNLAVTGEGEIARRLLLHRPGALRSDFTMAVQEGTGRAVSTTCLLRWKVLYQGISLDTAMLEMVVTDPGFRRYGLVRAQVDQFHRQARQQGMDLCIIQGIPYYYRQYGYAYALDHYPFLDLASRCVPGAARANGLRLRAATPRDIPALAELHDLEMARQGIWVRRSHADWDYLLGRAGRTAEILEGPGGAAAGFLCTGSAQDSIVVAEAGLRDVGLAPAVLGLLAARGPLSIAVCGNRAHSLGRAAADLGARPRDPDQWLVRLVDPASLLVKLAPALNERLDRAGFGGLDAELVINFYKGALRLTVTGGRITGVVDAGFVDASMGADGGDLCIPMEAFSRLLLGYRDLDQLRDAWPDIALRAKSRPIMEALFPRTDSLLLMPY